MKYLLFLIALTLVMNNYGCRNSEPDHNNSATIDDDYSSRIDSLIQITSPRLFNGVILITKNGKTVYEKAQGYADFESKIPLSIDDKFRIMSNSKQITAALILREAEKGNIDLMSPISVYLTDLDQSWADQVTVHQLLNMSSGIKSIDEPLLFEAGKGYRYSNPGYGLLGRIIEASTGRTYVDLANQLFEELDMTNTYCYDMSKKDPELTNGYWLERGEVNLVEFDSMEFNEETWKDFVPAGGIVSNARDLNIWDTKLHRGEIVSSDYHGQMVTPSNRGPHAAFDGDTIGYGYGLRVHDRHAIHHLGHGGRGFGFASIKFYISEKDVDVIIWENIYCRDDDFMAGDIVYHFENEIRKLVLNSNLVK